MIRFLDTAVRDGGTRQNSSKALYLEVNAERFEQKATKVAKEVVSYLANPVTL